MFDGIFCPDVMYIIRSDFIFEIENEIRKDARIMD
jgi:hypothetical protein